MPNNILKIWTRPYSNSVTSLDEYKSAAILEKGSGLFYNFGSFASAGTAIVDAIA